MPDQKLWIDNRHHSYEEAKTRRQFARDHYTGDAFDIALKEADELAASQQEFILSTRLDDTAGIRFLDSRSSVVNGTYLHKRAQGESNGAFQERAKITRFPSLMGGVVDSFVGGIFSVEDKAIREYGDILGKPRDAGSEFNRLSRDIDGSGLGWHSSLMQKGTDLIVDDDVWYKADRGSDRNGQTRIWALEPDNILNWREGEDGALVELLMREFRYEHGGKGLRDVEGALLVQYFILYDLDGWKRWKLIEHTDSQGKKTGERKLKFVGSDKWAFPIWTTPEKRFRRIPIGRESLPIKRPLGYQMAQDHNALYNLLSDARWLLRVINHPRLAGDVDDDQWIRSMEALLQGMNALQGNWNYISPDADNVKEGYNIFSAETNQFHIANNQRMKGSTLEKSATEVMFDEAAGRTSNLTLLKNSIDEIENDWMFLASQLEAPNKPEAWYDSYVERSNDFKPINTETLVTSQAIAFASFAGVLPPQIAARASKEGLTDDLINDIKNLKPDDFREPAGADRLGGSGEGLPTVD